VAYDAVSVASDVSALLPVCFAFHRSSLALEQNALEPVSWERRAFRDALYSFPTIPILNKKTRIAYFCEPSVSLALAFTLVFWSAVLQSWLISAV
jgi:hypothetical protein